MLVDDLTEKSSSVGVYHKNVGLFRACTGNKELVLTERYANWQNGAIGRISCWIELSQSPLGCSAANGYICDLKDRPVTDVSNIKVWILLQKLTSDANGNGLNSCKPVERILSEAVTVHFPAMGIASSSSSHSEFVSGSSVSLFFLDSNRETSTVLMDEFTLSHTKRIWAYIHNPKGSVKRLFPISQTCSAFTSN